MNINRASFVRRGAIAAGLERPPACTVDAFAVLGQPNAQIPQPISLFRINDSIGPGADVEQHVSISAGAVNQQVQACGGAFYAVIGSTPGPLVVRRNRHARLPGAGVLKGTDGLLRRVKVLRESAVAVVDEQGRLE